MFSLWTCFLSFILWSTRSFDFFQTIFSLNSFIQIAELYIDEKNCILFDKVSILVPHCVLNIKYKILYICTTNTHVMKHCMFYRMLYVQSSCAVWLMQGLYNCSAFSVVFSLRGFVDTYWISAERASQLINLLRPSMRSPVIIHPRTAINSKASVTWHTFPLKPMASQLLKHRV